MDGFNQAEFYSTSLMQSISIDEYWCDSWFVKPDLSQTLHEAAADTSTVQVKTSKFSASSQTGNVFIFVLFYHFFVFKFVLKFVCFFVCFVLGLTWWNIPVHFLLNASRAACPHVSVSGTASNNMVQFVIIIIVVMGILLLL